MAVGSATFTSAVAAMAKNIPRGKAQSRQDGLSLSKFAGAKKSKYNKQARLEKKAALNAKRVNQYRKIKGRYFENQQSSQSTPQINKKQAEGEEEDADAKRARSRAGPPPDELQESPGLSEDKPSEKDVHQANTEAAPPQTGEKKSKAKTKLFVAPSENDAGGETQGQQDAEEDQSNEAPVTEGKVKKPWKLKKKKPASQVQRLAVKVTNKKEAVRQEQAKRKKEAKKAAKRLRMAEKKRKKEAAKLLKKTKKGQPVMKHRIQKMVNKLQTE